MTEATQYAYRDDLDEKESLRENIAQFHECSDDEKSNTMYDLAERFYQWQMPELAADAEACARDYGRLADNVDGAYEPDQRLTEKTQALLDFHQWVDTGELPSPGQLADARATVSYLGDPPEGYANALDDAISERRREIAANLTPPAWKARPASPTAALPSTPASSGP